MPTNEPPQVPATVAVKPAFDVTVKAVVAPVLTVCAVPGLIVPFAPALGVTVKVIGAKVAVTVQLAVTAAVV